MSESGPKQCIGFGEREGICENEAGTPWTPLWCSECDQERRASITKAMAEITKAWASPVPPSTPVTDEMRKAGAQALFEYVRGVIPDGAPLGPNHEAYRMAAVCLNAAMPLVPSERRVAELEEENRALKQQMTRNQVARARAALGDRSPEEGT